MCRPQAAEDFDESLATRLAALDAQLVARQLEQSLGAFGHPRAHLEAKAASKRLELLQQILAQGRVTARELCFQLVPTPGRCSSRLRGTPEDVARGLLGTALETRALRA